MADDGPVAAVVPIASGWFSKINWAALVSAVAAVLSIWGVSFPPEAQDMVVKFIYAVANLITVAGPVFIFIYHQYFAKTVTTQSASNSPVIMNSAQVPQLSPSAPVANMVK